MSYVVLARKWRPIQFADVLGQEHVTQTLANAIRAERIAHAFLFSGPRGVGKTSAARILARALCCEAENKPTPTPCGQCRQCLEIGEGRSTDVFEIDAASHTSVDNIRELIDGVRYLPSSARYKIYVIDEVHMLSTGAFNALLKTLEEPPAHVKFVLATTDVHKVPVTILSRCQRYDFRRIPVARVSERLSAILQREGIEHDVGALALVAREGDGSMRDAQSLLEQVLAYANGQKLDGVLVRQALGVVDAALVERAFDALERRDPALAIRLAGEVHERGLDLVRFVDAMIEHARDLLVAKVVPNAPAVLDRPSDEIQRLTQQGKGLQVVALQRWFDQLCRLTETLKEAPFPRYALEIGLASLAEQPPHAPLPELVAQLERLELQLSGRGAKAAPRAERPEPRMDPRPPPRAEIRSAPEPRSEIRSEPQEPKAETKVETKAESRRPEPATKTEAPKGGDYAAFVGWVKARRPSMAASLLQVRPMVFEASRVVFGVETAFDEGKLQDPETKGAIDAFLSEFFGRKVHFEVTRSKDGGPRTLNEEADAARNARLAEKEKVARQSPAVKALQDELGAGVVKVRPIDEG